MSTKAVGNSVLILNVIPKVLELIMLGRVGLSRGAILKAVDASLKRLGTNYIDLLQIHRYDPLVPP